MLLAAYLRQDSVEDRNLTDGERNLLGPMIRESDNSNCDPGARHAGAWAPIESLANAGRHVGLSSGTTSGATAEPSRRMVPA